MQEVQFPVAVPGFTFTILIKYSQNAEVILTCKLVGGVMFKINRTLPNLTEIVDLVSDKHILVWKNYKVPGSCFW